MECRAADCRLPYPAWKLGFPGSCTLSRLLTSGFPDIPARIVRRWTFSLLRVRAGGEPLTAGGETHQDDGVGTPITSPDKTVVDCFKRRKMGLDVAIKAPRDLISRGRDKTG